jgi:carbonic anhydrase
MTKVPSAEKNLSGRADNGDGGESLRNGYSMEEAMEHASDKAQQAQARTPRTVLLDLQRGNARFFTGISSRPEKSAFERRALISQQFPAAAILGCSDSRVPIELVFDQGLGDLFVIRVAGNCLDTATTGSLEYATNHLKVKVLVVMGHSGCGAVKAAQLPAKDLDGEPEDLRNLLKGIKTGLDAEKLGHISDPRACDREAVSSNVKAQVARLVANPAVSPAVKSGELLVVGAFYDMASGIVDFYE